MDEPPTSPSLERLAHFETRAEAAYADMYEAHPASVKDLRDDAMMWLGRAIDEARALGREADVARLATRRAHITAVYDSQFRGVGWR